MKSNRHIGWALLIVGFAWAAYLDPWSLSERTPAALVGSARMAVRHAQAVVLGMAFLQLVVAEVLSASTFSLLTRRVSALLTGSGAMVYALGYVLHVVWSGGAWLIPVGAIMNFIGFMVLAWASRGERGAPILRVVLGVICLGMLLDAVMGLFALSPERFLPAYIGPEDGVRLRMLRLARAAAVALSVLTFLYHGLTDRATPQRRNVRWGQVSLLCGVVSMPTVLAAACFITVYLKYLLPVPALTTLAGTLIGLSLSRQLARPLETWGWLLIALSMAAGLCMGLYAFDGPLPSPVGGYNDFVRRLMRLGHAYCIVLGLLSIFVARGLDESDRAHWLRRAGVPLLVVGSIATIVIIMLVAAMNLPTAVLGFGPAFLAVATVMCSWQIRTSCAGK